MDSLPRHPPEDNRAARGAASTGRRDAPAPAALGPGRGRPHARKACADSVAQRDRESGGPEPQAAAAHLP
jgi:hypothetical protein